MMIGVFLAGFECSWTQAAEQSSWKFNGAYTGRHLNRVAFRIGAGTLCLEGTGAISHMSVRRSGRPRRLSAAHSACVQARTLRL